MVNAALGLDPDQQRLIRKSACFVHAPASTRLFEEGDPAGSLYFISSGEIEIKRKTIGGEVTVNRLSSGEIFGEMGILSCGQKRTATAIAPIDSVLLKIPVDPGHLLEAVDDADTSLALLKSLVCILAERLRSETLPSSRPLSVYRPLDVHDSPPEEAIETIRRQLPSGRHRFFSPIHKLGPKDVLFRQGSVSDSFYFIHSGNLDVLRAGDEPASERRLGRVRSPAVVGELGFFASEPRNADVIALEDVRYTRFSGEDFESLWYSDPRSAIEVLLAVCQIVVHLILHREC